MVLPTSRVSVEVVQKAAVMDVPVLIAVSAPSGRPGRPFGNPDLNPLRGFVFDHLQDRASQDTVGEPELIQNRVVIRVGDWNQIARKMSLRPVCMVRRSARPDRYVIAAFGRGRSAVG
jgi:hypothetical protein